MFARLLRPKHGPVSAAALVLGVLCFGSAAQAQVAEVQGQNVADAPIQPAPQPDADFVLPFPPIDTIPPIPMPEPALDQAGLTSPGGVTTFDAMTGRSAEYPEVRLPGLTGRVDGYRGADGGPGTEGYLGRTFGTMSKITTQANFPWRMNCKLVMRFTAQNGNQYWFVGSGSLIDVNTVITAGHCVYTRTATISGVSVNFFSWADVIYVLPGWDGAGNVVPPPGPGSNASINNYGWASGTAFIAGTNWVNNGSFDSDCGAVRLSDRAVGALTGWYGTAWGYDCGTIQGRTYNYVGFPSESCGGGLHNGADMYYWTGVFDSCPGNQLHINSTAGCFTTGWGGMSGGPFYYFDNGNRYVHAIDSNGNRGNSTNACKIWDGFFNPLFDSFIPDSRGNTFDLQALDANTNTASQRAGWQVSANFLAVNPTNVARNSTYTYRVYLSSNDNISASDVLLSTQTFTWNFAANSNVRVNIAPFFIPQSTTPGNYYIGVVLDPATDANSGNNATHTWDAVPFTVLTAAAANDFCANAQVATLGATFGSTAVASADGSASCGTSNATNDVWYRFVAPDTGIAYFDTCGSSYDTVLSIHSACTGTAANQLACSDDNGGAGPCSSQIRTSYIALPVVYGNSYYIRVSGFNTASGNFELNIDMPAPANDHCSNAAAMNPAVTYTGTTRLADTDGAASCGYSASAPDVWYTFVAPYDAMAVLNTCGSGFDTVLSVYTSCPGTLDSQIGCNDDNNGLGPCTSQLLTSYLEVPVWRGQTYYVRIGGWNGNRGDYAVLLNYAAPFYNTCSSALVVGPGTTYLNNTLATTDGPTEANCSFCCGDLQVNRDLWFFYTAPRDGVYQFDTIGSLFDTKIALYNACPAAPNTAFACNDDFSGIQSLVAPTLSAGQSIVIRVGAYNLASGEGQLNITEPNPPCETDLNQDGNADQGDVDCIIAAIAGDPTCIEIPNYDLDFNHDGNADQGDVDAFINTISGGGCP